MLIYMAFVFVILILRPLEVQNLINKFNRSYNPYALWDKSTASSAKASRKIYKVAISNINRFFSAILCYLKYSNNNGYT